MKTFIRNPFLLPALIAGLGLIPTGLVTAQTLTVLHHFEVFTEGGNPSVSEALTISGDTLYGATYVGGLNGVGGGTGRGTLFHRRSGARFLRHQPSSTGGTQ